MAFAGKNKKVLIIVENLPLPFDRRVWQEANTLNNNGYKVSIICPKGKGYNHWHENINGINIYRHPLPFEANGAIGYALEYTSAIFWEFLLSLIILFKHGFKIIHACNPPDTIFIIALFYKLFGKKFIFDHHDINPELYIAKFGKKDFFYKIVCLLEKMTFRTANICIATNGSYKRIAIERGRKNANDVYIVRSGPNLDRLKILPPNLALKNNKKYLVGYVGVMGKQEGIDLLLRCIKSIVTNHGRTDIHFGLVGGGTELEYLINYAQELSITDYVTFTGRVSDNEMLEMLNTADICVNPDIANEMNDKSTMNKIMEYMALEKPIVQFDLTEGRYSAQNSSLYAIKNDENDFANKIIQLLDNPELRKAMGEIGRNRVINELEWKYEEPKLLEAYSRV